MATKVALIAQFVPPFIGGIQTHLSRLGEGLIDLGYEVTIVGGSIARPRVLSNFPKLRLSLTPFDIVHLHGFERLLLASVLSSSPKRLIVTPHGGATAPIFKTGLVERLKRIADRKLFVPLLNRADRVIALNRTEVASLSRFGLSPSLICEIPNGVSLDPLVQPEPGPPYLVFVGRVVREKRLEFAIDMMPLLRDLTLKIAGPAQRDYLLALKAYAARLGVSDRVLFLGPVFGKEKAKLQSGALANVLFSKYDHQPISVLEAASYGVPSVAFPSPCIPELAAELTGQIEYAKTPDEAAACVRTLVERSGELRDEQSLRVRGALTKMSWENVVASVESLYREVLLAREDYGRNSGIQ